MHLKTLRYSRTHYFFLLSDCALLRQNAWDTRQMWESRELFEKKQQVWGHWWKDGQDEDAYLWRQALVSAYRSSTPLLCSLPSLIVWTSIFSWNFSTAELHLGPPAQVCHISFHHPVEGNKISQEIFGSWRLQHSPVSVSFDKTSHFLSNNFSESPNANWMGAGSWEMRTECSIADVPPCTTYSPLPWEYTARQSWWPGCTASPHFRSDLQLFSSLQTHSSLWSPLLLPTASLPDSASISCCCSLITLPRHW